MDFRTIKEEYNSIYSKASQPQVLSEDVELVEQYLDEEYEAIVEQIVSDEDSIEEIVFEMLDEGFTAEEIEDIFDEIFEAQVTTGQGSRMAAASRLARMQAAKKITKQKERKEKVKAAVDSAKGAVKGALSAAKGKASDAKSAARGAVKDAKRSSHVGLAKYASKRNLMPGPGLKTQSSKGRGELRRAVAKDVAGRAAAKVDRAKSKATAKAASAAVSGYAAARSAKQAASDVKNRAVQSAKNKAAVAKRGIADRISAAKDKVKAAKAGVKSSIGKAARKVADKAGGVASRMGEETNYDLVLKYLYMEGHVETLEEAEQVMVNLSHEEIEAILEQC
jgi:phage-related protein